MRRRRLRAALGPPHLVDEERLADLGRPRAQACELPATRHAFDHHDDRARPRVVDKIVHRVERVDIHGVARRDPTGEADSPVLGLGKQKSEGAALRDDAEPPRVYVPGERLDEVSLDATVKVDEPQAVRAEKPHATARQKIEFLLQRLPLG